MKNIAINTLKYTGIVTLSQCIKGKKVKIAQKHNAGGTSLFNFLTDCLVGDFSLASLYIPNKVRLLTKEDDESLSSSTGFIYMQTRPEKVLTDSSQVASAKYSFIIPKEQLETNINKIVGIGLYAKSTTIDDISNYAARCDIDFSQVDIQTKSDLLIDWELTFSNIQTILDS